MDAGDRDASPQLADIDTLLMAHHIAPEESLVVRLLGTVGPNGSWRLDRIAVRLEGERVILEPRVARVPGDAFIQMLIPLDHAVRLHLGVGRCVVEARGARGVHADTVQVRPQARRTPPETTARSESQAVVGTVEVVSIHIVGRSADGFVDRIEIRDTTRLPADVWHAPETVQRQGNELHAWTTLQRPAGDPERRLEARAVDGQGAADPSPAVVVLPGRP